VQRRGPGRWQARLLPTYGTLLPAATACSLCSAVRCHLAAAHRHSLLQLAAAACCRCLPLLKSFVLHERRFVLRLCSLCSAARCHLAAAHCHSLPLLAAAACCCCLLLLKSFVLHERRFVLRLWQDTRNLSITSKGVAIRHRRFASQCTRLSPNKTLYHIRARSPESGSTPEGYSQAKHHTPPNTLCVHVSTIYAVCGCIYNLRCVCMSLSFALCVHVSIICAACGCIYNLRCVCMPRMEE
jgi:hypothetical protein